MSYSPESLMQMLRDERTWAKKVLVKIKDDLLDWPIPNTPYTVSWLLWHMGESHHWVHNAVVKMKKEDGEPIGYPEWKKGEKTVKEYVEIYLKQSEALEKTVSKMTSQQLNKPQNYLSMFGQEEAPLGQIIAHDIFHVLGHLTVISFAHGLRGRIQGEKQKWPPY